MSQLEPYRDSLCVHVDWLAAGECEVGVAWVRAAQFCGYRRNHIDVAWGHNLGLKVAVGVPVVIGFNGDFVAGTKLIDVSKHSPEAAAMSRKCEVTRFAGHRCIAVVADTNPVECRFPAGSLTDEPSEVVAQPRHGDSGENLPLAANRRWWRKVGVMILRKACNGLPLDCGVFGVLNVRLPERK